MSWRFSPPLPGADMTITVAVQTNDFSVADEYNSLRQLSHCGAVVTFTGLVRELNNNSLNAMTLEHYPGMTEHALTTIATQARQRWQLGSVRVVHRVGTLKPNEQIVFVGVASAHRAAAFAACEFIMDYLKNRAPFWKKEHTASGDYWVEAKQRDQDALQRWE